uniref:transcription initiation factor TFIID subunit 4b-like isoform X2 n=1 Tax=Erigeron canadensis TaxID=72917 RepID=UPI001CB91446|nr:transcription initiation factor TFIID subunit 4b-like isoform X2 [Erigeron canadensis]
MNNNIDNSSNNNNDNNNKTTMNNNNNNSALQVPTNNTSAPQLPTTLSQGTNHTPSQLFQQWQSSKREVKVSFPNEEDVKPNIHELKASAMEVNRHASGRETQHPPNDTSRDITHVKSEPSRPQDDQRNAHMSQVMHMQSTDKNPAQNIARIPDNEAQLQRMRSQQAVAAGQAATNAMNRSSGKQVPFALLLPVIEPQLDKDKAMQLQGLYARLRNNNINKDEFVRHMRSLVGDHMLKMAVYKLQQGQIPAQHSAKIGTQKPSSFVGSPPLRQASESSSQAMDSNAQKARLMEHQSDLHGVQASHMISNASAMKQEREQPPFPIQGLGKQQQQHIHFPQSSFPTYGNTSGNYHPSSNPNMNMPSQSLQMRQGPVHPTMGSQPMNPMSLPDMKRMHAAGLTHYTSNSPNSGHWQPSMHKDQSLMSSMPYAKPDSLDQMNDQQHKSQLSTSHNSSSFSSNQHEHGSGVAGSSKDDSLEMMSSRPGFSTPMNKLEPKSITAQLERQNVATANSQLGSGSNIKTPPKKPVVGQKKPLEAPVNSISKKQKVSGAFSDQSIEQLNDVTAVSGVNLKEEEEQLFSGSKEDSRVSEASRKVVQEEEERLILQKSPLQKKLAEIMAKCGVKSRSNDVERCLSLCAEERLRGLISNLIRLSKQRVDIEKPRYRTVITSDVRQQIMSMNQKAREEWEKKQADAEKLQRADEPEGSGDGDDGRGKFSKVNKEEDDKMRTTAANVAARAAVGGDDMLSKWQLMAEQARQKREGGPDVPSTSQPSVEVGPKPVLNSERSSNDNPDTERSSAVVTATPGSVKKSSRNQDLVQNNSNIARTITVKDVISVLGREVQMSRSTLIYRLYEKVRSNSVSE